MVSEIREIGVTAGKANDFSEWYTQVVMKAELADYSAAKGFMILRPYGYAIWERIQKLLDREIKKLGHQNIYFPVLIPESLLAKEADHFAGFIPQVFWVTSAGDTTLGERLATRPTSEAIAYASFSKWVKSWRDLPLLLNCWNSVLRAEIKGTKPFIRTSEFLWQEGHTAHEKEADAEEEVYRILELYRSLIEKILAVPVYVGYKSEKEKFVGAEYTTTLEALMPDGRALQMGTSHNLGQNFSKPFEIRFLGQDNKEHFAWQTSWGVSWRLIGALIMTHGDDKGLVLPPRIAPIHCVIVPIYYNVKDREEVRSECERIQQSLKSRKVRTHLDDRDHYTPGWKFHNWELKGVPLRIEIGPRDIKAGEIVMVRRDQGKKVRVRNDLVETAVINSLREMQENLYESAQASLRERTTYAKEYSELMSYIQKDFGFVKAAWCGDESCEERVKDETGADIRLIPLTREEARTTCVVCRKESKHVAYFAKAY
ncbi:MAG: proline--tRNA ligase [Nitrososphaerales archaeon]